MIDGRFLNTTNRKLLHVDLKFVHFGHGHSLLFAPVKARFLEKALSLSYQAKMALEQ